MHGFLLLLLVFVAESAFAQTPLDVQDPTPRMVEVALEGSAAPNLVGQNFGPPYEASWTSGGNTGTLTIPVATHEQLREGGGWTAVPGSFDPIVIEIDLTTLEATSLLASGTLQNGNLSLAFTQNALDTDATVSYIGPDVEPFVCTSQADVAAFCAVLPEFCGQVCIPVDGVAYDDGTGTLNLVGSETQTGCDGGVCFGPFEFFAGGGDLRITEAPVSVPVMTPLSALVVGALLVGGARWRRCSRSP